MTEPLISTLRRFNRTYTQRVGALEESFLGTGRPLAASRVLFEIGTAGGCTVRHLRDLLGLDSGQLARLLRALETDGLVRTEPDADDRRVRVARLTPAGSVAYDDLERRSEDRAVALVAPLTDRQQGRLAEALRTADLLVRAATVRLVEVAAHDPRAQEATRRYVAELDRRFPDGFDPGPSGEEPETVALVATSDAQVIAHGALRPVPEVGTDVAEVKRMWVDAGWRGAGLGARMLRRLEDVAWSRGFARVVLDTNGALGEAIALYERSGYTRIERYNDNPYAEAFFAKERPEEAAQPAGM